MSIVILINTVINSGFPLRWGWAFIITLWTGAHVRNLFDRLCNHNG